MFATTVYARYAKMSLAAQQREKQKLRALQAQLFPQQGQKRERKNTINDYVGLKFRFGEVGPERNCIAMPCHAIRSPSAASKTRSKRIMLPRVVGISESRLRTWRHPALLHNPRARRRATAKVVTTIRGIISGCRRSTSAHKVTGICCTRPRRATPGPSKLCHRDYLTGANRAE